MRWITFLFFLPTIVFADINIFDSNGLLRASKATQKSLKVVVETASPVNEVKLVNSEGLTADQVGTGQGQRYTFEQVDSGSWQIKTVPVVTIQKVTIN